MTERILVAACIKTALTTRNERRKGGICLVPGREEGKGGEKLGWNDHEKRESINHWRGKV